VDELLCSIYMVEIRFQAKIAANAMREIERLARHRFRGRIREQTERMFGLWTEIHSFLAAVGVISKILWPVKAEKARRNDALKLRAMLGVDGSSPLADRRVRDAMEHIDERMAKWYEQNKGRKLAGWKITANGEPADPNLTSLREFNQDTLKFRTYDAECDLRGLNQAAQNCANRILVLAQGKDSFAGEPNLLL
jgi:hypothetical protein